MKSFVKRIVRTPLVALPAALPRAIVETTIDHPLPRRAVSQEETSGLTPVEISVVLGTFLVVFIICLFVGLLCKVFNRPTAEAHPYYANGNLYQPSAAGYGAKGGPGSNAAARQEAAVNDGPTMLSVQGAYGSRTSLLGAASPMGAGGGGYGSPTIGSGPTDYFATGLSANNHGRSASSSQPGLQGHARGESSGIRMPGPSAAARRPGAQGAAHPALPGGGPSPDGGGFKPGQVFNHPSGPGFSGPQLRAAPRGPPPATDARRRSRYTRADGRRIDSVGPGVYRKSMYMPEDGGGGGGGGGGGNGGLGAGLRRVDSVGRGDARRRSQAVLGGQRAPSVYAVGTDRATLRSAQADNFGAGRAPAPQRTPSSDRSDPLGANRNYPPPGAPGSGPPGAALQAGPRVRQPQHQQHPMPQQSGTYASNMGRGPPPPQFGMPNGQPGAHQPMNPQARGPPRPGGPPMPPYSAAPSHGMGGPMGQYAQPQMAGGGVGRQIL